MGSSLETRQHKSRSHHWLLGAAHLLCHFVAKYIAPSMFLQSVLLDWPIWSKGEGSSHLLLYIPQGQGHPYLVWLEAKLAGLCSVVLGLPPPGLKNWGVGMMPASCDVNSRWTSWTWTWFSIIRTQNMEANCSCWELRCFCSPVCIYVAKKTIRKPFRMFRFQPANWLIIITND